MKPLSRVALDVAPVGRGARLMCKAKVREELSQGLRRLGLSRWADGDAELGEGGQPKAEKSRKQSWTC